MWITGKTDQTLQKDQLFTMLCKEIRTLAPGACLSYNLRNRLERFSKDERKEIASRTLDGCAPLFVVCQRGNAEVVEYLIATCDANVEQKGLYEVSDDHSVHHVTPLWCAAVAGKLAVVKCLIQHGADVNSVSDTGSTPVRSACFMTHFDIVTFLVENGANISKPNYNGGTCLINSVQSVALCEYLIKNGADVNAQDIQNKTALHYAIQEHRYETTKLLLEHGADPFLKSKYNDDALQTACIKGAKEIFKCLIEMFKYGPKRIAEGYELLGSTFLDEHHDMQLALKCWRKAANVRLKHNLEKEVKDHCKAFQFVKEFRNLEELETISCDQDLVRIQSLLICERILGTSHKDMIFRLMYRGAAYADSLQYQNCINLWLYALQLKIKRDTILFSDTCFTAQALVRLYIDMIEKFNCGHITNKVSFEDAYETLELISSEIPASMKLLTIQPVHKRHQSSFDIMLKVLTHMIYVLLHISMTEEQQHRVAVIVNRILRLDPRTCQGGFSLLHLSVMKTNIIYNNSLLEDQHMMPFPSLEVIQFLLECGANVNATTLEKGLSPLYIASQLKNYKTEVVETLIRSGAHIDQATFSGESPTTLLARNPDCHISLVSFISLKCLAAKAI
ncbi:Protein fem-1-like protein C [Armadillidium nasatum]|uniref:Protein fem-1-like protein C n=1 Tax=Armadillidium nasatum TaxID=96803 RepID=A0A5N5SUI2_9CRUS|nr:Protein fem-1-like protein C [Armadillidium nasatum]